MGRRKRPRQEDEGDDLESYEREWLLHRGKGSTRQQVAGDDVKANDTELSSNTSAFADDLKNPMSNVSSLCTKYRQKHFTSVDIVAHICGFILGQKYKGYQYARIRSG